jgi:hypothetical protein
MQMPNLSRFSFALTSACFLGASQFVCPAGAATYTSSSAFNTATAGDTVTVENYSSGTAGETIANHGSLDGLTYSFTAGPSGTLTGGIITDEFFSFSGLSLGRQSVGLQDFLSGDSVTVTFAAPVTAVGAFFNVNLDTGNYDLNSAAGNASAPSTFYDTDTFVFAGITSDSPFSSITLVSTGSNGNYNAPEIEFVTATATPLPAAFPLFAGGLGMIGLIAGRKKRKAAASATT